MVKNYIKLILGIVFCLYYSPCFGGSFSIDEIDPDAHRMHYNSLPSVEVADKELNSRTNFQDFLKKAGDVIVSHGLEDSVGLRLIHRHFGLTHEQVMVEAYEKYQETPSLITTAYSLSNAREIEATPSSWIFVESKPTVFEFTTDPAARVVLKKIQNSRFHPLL